MKNAFTRLICFAFFSLLIWQSAIAQYLSDQVDYLIYEHDFLRDSDSTEVGISLNPWQTLPNYYRSTYLYLHDELQDQLDQLIEIGPLPRFPLTDPGGRQILEEHIAAEGRMVAKIKELDLVSKAAKISGSPLPSPYYLLPDWQLRSYHHQLSKTFALNEGFSGEEMETFKAVYDNALGALERELRERGMFPKSIKSVPNWQQLLQDRFECVEALNFSVRQEAVHLVDYNSGLVFEEQVRIAALTEQIAAIDEKLGIEPDKRANVRHLWTEETVVFRIEILEYGKKTVHEKLCATRAYSDDNLLHLTVIDEQLAQEKKWLYFEKNHQVVKKGYTSRSPPNDLPPIVFEEPPFPKELSFGDLTLDRFLDETKVASIEKNKEAAFEKAVTRHLDRFKAYYLDRPQWSDNIRVTKYASSTPPKTPESYLRFLAIRHLETMSLGQFGQAGQYKAAFDVTMQRLYPDENSSPVSLLEDQPAKLHELEIKLRQAHQNAEKRVAAYGNMATPAMHYEAVELKTTLEQVKAIRESAPPSPRLEKGQKVNRPPPSWTDWPEIINNEAHVKAVLIAEKQSLERTKAWYGIDVPASVEYQLKTINETLVANEMASSLGEYQKYAEDASDLKILKRYSELFPDLFPDVKELEVRQAALFTDFDETFERAKSFGEKSVPPKLFEAARNAHKSLKGSKKGVKGDGVWRPNQDLDKIKSMNLAKDPGGIWLSPNGFEIPPVISLDLQWKPVPVDEGCPNYDDFEWIIDPDAEDVEIICFPSIQKSLIAQHWLNQIKSW